MHPDSQSKYGDIQEFEITNVNVKAFLKRLDLLQHSLLEIRKHQSAAQVHLHTQAPPRSDPKYQELILQSFECIECSFVLVLILEDQLLQLLPAGAITWEDARNLIRNCDLEQIHTLIGEHRDALRNPGLVDAKRNDDTLNKIMRENPLLEKHFSRLTDEQAVQDMATHNVYGFYDLFRVFEIMMELFPNQKRNTSK